MQYYLSRNKSCSAGSQLELKIDENVQKNLFDHAVGVFHSDVEVLHNVNLKMFFHKEHYLF